jgi:drug/metabolite transporter (DMT)-like permease
MSHDRLSCLGIELSIYQDRGQQSAAGAVLRDSFRHGSIDTELSSLMFMALQMLMGGLMLLGLGLVHGDAAHWAPNTSGLMALLYLTFFSSCLAYTAYGWLSLNAAPALIGTYGYVNPAIASFLGWQFLHEHLSRSQLVGMVVIIAGVSMLTLPGGSLTDPKTLAEPKTQ